VRQTVRVLAAFAFRALQALSGFIVYYGATGMLTTAGLRPPNAIVLMGLAAVGLTTIAASRAERRPLAGLWVAAIVVALPFLLWSIAHFSDTPCPPDHPPLTPAHSCGVPGAPLVLALSGAVLFAAIVGALAELRSLWGGRRAVELT
jgi:hypothetical protein